MKISTKSLTVSLVVLALIISLKTEHVGFAKKTKPAHSGSNDGLPSVALSPAPLIQMPGVTMYRYTHAVDSNSPVHWDGDTIYLFNSFLHPFRFSGPDIEHLGNKSDVHLGHIDDNLFMWIEATYKDSDGTLWGAYHHEPDGVCFADKHLPTAPKIGWLRSEDNGKTWKDLGFIIMASPCAINCQTASPFDVGGRGDFVFFPDKKKEYIYFYGTSYDPDFKQQGVWAARMRYSDRNNPSGKVKMWYKGGWNQPAIWDKLTPVFPATKDYTHKDGSMFWGPSVHWNSYLNMYVMFLNHAINTHLDGDGIYVSFNRHIGDVKGWSKPVRILDPAQIKEAIGDDTSNVPDATNNGWYPEVIGTEKGQSDKLCGRTGRFFMAGISRLEITFLKPGERAK
jgi:hypothetical protein